jgi:hypothetical protein
MTANLCDSVSLDTVQENPTYPPVKIRPTTAACNSVNKSEKAPAFRSTGGPQNIAMGRCTPPAWCRLVLCSRHLSTGSKVVGWAGPWLGSLPGEKEKGWIGTTTKKEGLGLVALRVRSGCVAEETTCAMIH